MMAGRRAGGPETYEVNLLQALCSISPAPELQVYCLSRAAAATLAPSASAATFHIIRPSARWISIPFTLPLKLLGSKIDLLHATFTPPPVSPKRYVLT